MPYRLEMNQGVLRVTLTGELNFGLLTSLLDEFGRFEDGPGPVPHRLMDLTMLTGTRIDYIAMLDFAKRRNARIFPNPFKSAVVAIQPVHLGYARMFQTLMDNPQIQVRIFPTRAEAETWLGLDGEPAE